MVNDQAQSLDHLTERYGRRRRTDRGVTIAVVGAFALLVTFVGWMFYQSANDPVRAALHSWDLPRDGVLPATIEIDRAAGLGVTCELAAVDLRRVVVGQLELDVPPGPDEHILVTADIPLQGDGVVARLKGCRPAD